VTCALADAGNPKPSRVLSWCEVTVGGGDLDGEDRDSEGDRTWAADLLECEGQLRIEYRTSEDGLSYERVTECGVDEVPGGVPPELVHALRYLVLAVSVPESRNG